MENYECPQPPETEPARHDLLRRVGRAIGRPLLIASVVCGAMLVSGPETQIERYVVDLSTVEEVPSNCATEPSKEQLDYVEARLVEVRSSTQTKPEDKEVVAKRHNVQLPDTTMLQDIIDDTNPGDAPKLPFTKYIEASQAFFKQYGATFDLAPPGKYEGGVPVTVEQLDNNLTKRLMTNILTAFYEQPTELLKGYLKQVYLLDWLAGAQGEQAGGARYPGSLYLDIVPTWLTPKDARVQVKITAEHELSHIIDYSQCKNPDPYKDRRFNALNPIWYSPTSYDSPEPDNPENAKYSLFATIYNQELCQTRRTTLQDGTDVQKQEVDQRYKQAAQNIYVTQNYSRVNDTEDKANLDSEIIFQPSMISTITPDYSSLYNKLVYGFGRLHVQHPNIADYLLDRAKGYPPLCG